MTPPAFPIVGAVTASGRVRLDAFAITTSLRSSRTLEKAGFGVPHGRCCDGWVAE